MKIKTSYDIWNSCNDFGVSTEFNHIKWVKVEDVIERIDIIIDDIEHIRGRGTLEATKLLKWKLELHKELE
jgi:hypothetical protein